MILHRKLIIKDQEVQTLLGETFTVVQRLRSQLRLLVENCTSYKTIKNWL